MALPGSQLEDLVSTIEGTLLPPGFRIETRKRLFTPNGVQLAEFDLVITGNIGSASIKWLIECRDRPADGPASAAWIEQLVGRRQRFNFNKVSAVSTTGFATGAVALATEEDIDLRTVNHMTPQEFTPWFQAATFFVNDHYACATDAQVNIHNDAQPDLTTIRSFLQDHTMAEPVLLDPSGILISIEGAFQLFVHANPDLFDRADVGRLPKEVALTAQYPREAERFTLETPVGRFAVTKIHFQAIMSRTRRQMSISEISSYLDSVSGGSLAQVVTGRFRMRGRPSELTLIRCEKPAGR